MAEAIRAFGMLSGGAQVLVVVTVCLVVVVVGAISEDFFNFLAECCRSYRQYRPPEKPPRKGED